MFKIFTNGIFKDNPLLVQLLGVCPALATTTSLENALGMGAAFTLVLIFSNLIIAAIKNFIPDNIRIPCYIVVIASLVTVTELIIHAYFPATYEALGIFIPLIVVNCIILGRAEAFASKHNLFDSFLDAAGMGLGYTLALSIIAALRELLGSGTLLGWQLQSTVPPILFFILPGGAFITMGFIFGALNYLRNHRRAYNGK